jgi:hypothetical protein
MRAARAVESFRSAADCIGSIEPGSAVFAVTRGQFSMVDAVLHVLDEVGRAERLSLWTWTVADYEIETFRRLMMDGRIGRGVLVIDGGARAKNAALIRSWQGAFGADSVRYVLNHAKIATVEGAGLRVLLRGSMNLNHNPRFEQLDVSEGGPAFELVRDIEEGLPVLADDAAGSEVYRASKVSDAFEPEQLAAFSKLRRWAK